MLVISGHRTKGKRHRGAGQHCCPLHRHPELQGNHLSPGQIQFCISRRCRSGFKDQLVTMIWTLPFRLHLPADPVLIPWDLAAKSCSRQQRQDQALTAKCLQDLPATLLRGRTTSPCQHPGAVCLSWAPRGTSLPCVCWGPSSNWGDG